MSRVPLIQMKRTHLPFCFRPLWLNCVTLQGTRPKTFDGRSFFFSLLPIIIYRFCLVAWSRLQ